MTQRPSNQMRLRRLRYSSPVGPIECLVTDENDPAVVALEFDTMSARTLSLLTRHFGKLQIEADAHDRLGIVDALDRYFGGTLDALDGLPVKRYGTPFQQSVWTALRRIPAGQTTSYAALARALGVPLAQRAVGAANGANPISLIVPCHRVIGSSGSLIKYGGGLERKSWLLRHEGALASAASS